MGGGHNMSEVPSEPSSVCPSLHRASPNVLSMALWSCYHCLPQRRSHVPRGETACLRPKTSKQWSQVWSPGPPVSKPWIFPIYTFSLSPRNEESRGQVSSWQLLYIWTQQVWCVKCPDSKSWPCVLDLPPLPGCASFYKPQCSHL